MTAPTFRSVDQQTGDVERPSAFFAAMTAADERVDEVDRLSNALHISKLQTAKATSDLAEARAELDDAMEQLRLSTESNAGLAKWAGVYQTERDEMREERDEARDVAADYLCTIGGIEVELREARTALAAAESERDTARAAVSGF